MIQKSDKQTHNLSIYVAEFILKIARRFFQSNKAKKATKFLKEIERRSLLPLLSSGIRWQSWCNLLIPASIMKISSICAKYHISIEAFKKIIRELNDNPNAKINLNKINNSAWKWKITLGFIEVIRDYIEAPKRSSPERIQKYILKANTKKAPYLN